MAVEGARSAPPGRAALGIAVELQLLLPGVKLEQVGYALGHLFQVHFGNAVPAAVVKPQRMLAQRQDVETAVLREKRQYRRDAEVVRHHGQLAEVQRQRVDALYVPGYEKGQPPALVLPEFVVFQRRLGGLKQLPGLGRLQAQRFKLFPCLAQQFPVPYGVLFRLFAALYGGHENRNARPLPVVQQFF